MTFIDTVEQRREIYRKQHKKTRKIKRNNINAHNDKQLDY